MLSIRIHLTLMLMAQFGMFFVGFLAGLQIGGSLIVAFGHSPDGDFSFIWYLFGVAGAMAFCSSSIRLFKNHIPARCGNRHCRGTAYCCDFRPISYQCESCGLITKTPWTDD